MNQEERAIRQQEREAAEKRNIEEEASLKKAVKFGTYGSMFAATARNGWNAIKELYAHPEILALLGLGWVTTKYLIPSKIEVWKQWLYSPINLLPK